MVTWILMHIEGRAQGGGEILPRGEVDLGVRSAVYLSSEVQVRQQ